MNKYLIALSVLVVAVLLDRIRLWRRPGLRSLPGPFWAKFTGLYRLAIVWRGTGHSEFTKLHEKYGPMVRIGSNHICVIDPEVIPQMYGTGSKFRKGDFYKVLAPWYQGEIMETMFSTRDPVEHKALRGTVANIFSATNMRNFEPHVDKCTAMFMEAMDDLEGQSLDFADWMHWYAFDVIAELTFQRNFGFLEQRKDVDNMIRDIDFGLHTASLIGMYPGLYEPVKEIFGVLGKLSPNYKDAFRTFMDITEDQIDAYEKSEKTTTRTDFMAQLKVKDANTGKVTPKEFVNHLSTNLLAGSDTTAIWLRGVIYYLVKTPHAYKKMVAELAEADRNGQLSEYITYAETQQLTYLQATMKEAMRIHPGVAFPLERRVPAGGAEVLGVNLPGGTVIGLPAHIVHRNKDIFGEDADEFRPERWLEAPPEQLKAMERCSLAFGTGARVCIGKNLASMETGKLIAQLLRHYDVEWASSEKEWKTYTVWLYKQTDMPMRVKRRTQVSA